MRCSIDNPRQIVFDRSPNVKPNSVLLIASREAIRRFDTETGVMSTLKTSCEVDAAAMQYTPSGHHLIVSGYNVDRLYSFDVASGAVVAISTTAGFADGPGTAAAFDIVRGLAIVEHEQCVYTCDYQNNRIRRITLPPQLFIASAPGGAGAGDVKTTAQPIVSGGVHSACDASETELAAADLKTMTDRCTNLTQEVASLTGQLKSVSDQLKASESLVAAAQARIAELEKRLSERDSKRLSEQNRGGLRQHFKNFQSNILSPVITLTLLFCCSVLA